MSKLLGVPSRRRFIQLGAAATATGLFAPSIARAAARKIKIGYVGPLSGVRADFGATEKWTIEMVKKHVANGLTLNGTHYDVELVVRDNRSDQQYSATVASELILRERCNLILAPDGDAAMALGELADTRRVPTISSMAPWQAWLFPRGGTPDKGFPYTFHFFAGSDAVLNAFTSIFSALDTNKNVGTLFLDNPAGRGLMDPNMGLPAALGQAGFNQTEAGPFQLSSNDFSNQVSTFREANVDILSGFMYAHHFVPFWNQVAQAGLSPKACAMAAAFLFPSSVNALGDRGDGLGTEVWWTPNFPFESSITGNSAKALATAWEDSTGQQWTQPLGYGHAMWEVALAALANAADPLDPDSLRDGIATLSTDTVIGPVDFAHSPIKSVAITGLVAGQWRKNAGGKYPYELKVVDNAMMPQVPVDAEVVALSL